MKRLFTLIVLLAFAVGMIGCKPSESSTTTSSTNTVPEAPAAAPATTNQ